MSKNNTEIAKKLFLFHITNLNVIKKRKALNLFPLTVVKIR